MTKRLHVLLIVAGLSFIMGSPPLVSATPIVMNFTVEGFGSTAPENPVVGTISWDADSATSTIKSLTSINLTISGHTYALPELAYLNAMSGSRPIAYIGGSASTWGVRGITQGTNDFWVVWRTDTLDPFSFRYASAGADGSFGSTDFKSFSVAEVPVPEVTSFSVAAVPVPEPATMILLSAGLMGLAGFKWRFKK